MTSLTKLTENNGLATARVQLELDSVEGVSFLKEFRAKDFLCLLKEATETLPETSSTEKKKATDGENNTPITFGANEAFWSVGRSFIADTVPGQGAQVAVPTNPAFATFFQGNASGEKSGGQQEEAEKFSVSKVWIEDGCIVCNACEDIYPEVFKVIADGCEVHPGHPTDDGLKVQEAAEACPVEIIKFAVVA